MVGKMIGHQARRWYVVNKTSSTLKGGCSCELNSSSHSSVSLTFTSFKESQQETCNTSFGEPCLFKPFPHLIRGLLFPHPIIKHREVPRNRLQSRLFLNIMCAQIPGEETFNQSQAEPFDKPELPVWWIEFLGPSGKLSTNSYRVPKGRYLLKLFPISFILRLVEDLFVSSGSGSGSQRKAFQSMVSTASLGFFADDDI